METLADLNYALEETEKDISCAIKMARVHSGMMLEIIQRGEKELFRKREMILARMKELEK